MPTFRRGNSVDRNLVEHELHEKYPENWVVGQFPVTAAGSMGRRNTKLKV